MDTLEPLFGKVTWSSISGDIFISIVLVLGLSLYIYNKGVKNIYILAILLNLSLKQVN